MVICWDISPPFFFGKHTQKRIKKGEKTDVLFFLQRMKNRVLSLHKTDQYKKTGTETLYMKSKALKYLEVSEERRKQKSFSFIHLFIEIRLRHSLEELCILLNTPYN